METLQNAFWETLGLFYRKPILLILGLLGVGVTALIVWALRPKEVFMEHLRAKVGIPALAGIATFLLIFIYMVFRSPYNQLSDLQVQLGRCQEEGRSAVMAKQTAERELEAERAIKQVLSPIKRQCWLRNYAVPAIPSPPSWGLATILCNTTIKPPYSVELNYDQGVMVGPITFPVGSEFTRDMESNQGTKVVTMVDLHTIIPNEPFSIMAHGASDKAPLVKTGTIRAKGVAFELQH